MGMATQRTCEDLKRQLVEVAAKAIGGTPDEWRCAAGQLWRGERPYPIGGVIGTLARSLAIRGKGHYSTPRADNVWQGVVPLWELSVGAAEVEVDPETGDVTLLQYVVDGEPISACTYLAFEASGKAVTTIEGLAPEGRLDPLQEAFIRRGAAQCGFCTSGMLLTCKALLEAYPKPTREQIGRYLNGNICRCGAYVQILEAIQDAVEARQSLSSGLPWPP
jgi:aerobic carbon-monoxide dehydrogenase small subunit